MTSSFVLGGSTSGIPSYGSGFGGTYGGTVNMQGLADQINQGNLAGRYSFDPEEVKRFQDMFGDKETGAMLYYLDKQKREANDPQRLKERLDVLGPWYEQLAEKNQRFGLQSNLVSAGLNALNKIPDTINAMRAIPLQGLYAQTQTIPNIFEGGSRPGFSGIRNRLGVG